MSSAATNPHAVHVPNAELAAHAERLLPLLAVERRELALGFDESAATSSSGPRRRARTFFPCSSRTSRRADVVHPLRPVRLQAGEDRRPLRRGAGRRRRRRACRSGSSSTRTARRPKAARRRSTSGSSPPASQVCINRAARRPRAPSGPLGSGRRDALEPRGLGHVDHRKFFIIDGRVGWVGGAGIEDHFEDGRFHDLFVRLDGPGRQPAPARVPRQPALAGRRRRLRRRSPRSSRRTTSSRRRGAGRRAAQRAGEVPAHHRGDRRARSTRRRGRSTSSTRTSPTAG